MGVSLTKGGNVSLTKEAPNLTAVVVGLGWDARSTTGAAFDLDASAIGAGSNKKVLSDQHFIFFNNLRSPDGSIEHKGDNTDGEGEGDDEQIDVNLAAVPAESRERCLPRLDLRRRGSLAVLRSGPQRVHPRRRQVQRQRARSLRPLRGRFHRDRHGLR